MSRLALRIAKLARVREERRRAIILVHPAWTGAAGKPMGVIAPGLSEKERAKLLAEAVAEWEAQRKAAQSAQEAAPATISPEPTPQPSPADAEPLGAATRRRCRRCKTTVKVEDRRAAVSCPQCGRTV